METNNLPLKKCFSNNSDKKKPNKQTNKQTSKQTNFLFKNLKISCSLNHILFKFHQHEVQVLIPLGYFILPLLMLTLEVYSLSIHYLISIWTKCCWNWNKIVWSELHKILSFFFYKKMVNHFWQGVDAILKNISATETIVWCQTINLKNINF